MPAVSRENRKEAVPYAHYLERYRALNPHEAAGRCGLPFDEKTGAFSLRFMGTPYAVPHPDFDLRPPEPALTPAPGQKTGVPGLIPGPAAGIPVPVAKETAERILLLRYLCEGRLRAPSGAPLSYHDIPSGGVYYRNFEGRCLKRLAGLFGKDLPGFRAVMEGPVIRGQPLGRGDAGYRFEFITGIFMYMILWGADEEFPASAQILFDENFPAAFTAEDAAVAGEAAIERLKALR
ncbi:MAG: DUF3786 domain-containing protein [Spirochaetaceae bacterium]|nr:DUF3786 domain-containing protein [Spirochaetaceae bacterium]